MSDCKIEFRKNPLPDGTPQREFLTDAEFYQVAEIVKTDSVMAAIHRQAEKINRNRGLDEPDDDEIPVAGCLPKIAAVIHDVTSRDSSAVLAFRFVVEFLKEENLI